MLLWDLGFVMRPIDAWPGERTKTPVRSPFAANWSVTKDLMRRELRHLGAGGPMASLVALKQNEIRVDGSGYLKGAHIQHYGVILSFNSRFGPLKYACDRFGSWDDNVRAIALGLEALRKVERYGISRRGEQYQGYKQLPGSVAVMTPDVAANVLERWSSIPAAAIASNREVAEAAFKIAAKKTHPDAGGTDVDFRAVEEARRVILNGEAA